MASTTPGKPQWGDSTIRLSPDALPQPKRYQVPPDEPERIRMTAALPAEPTDEDFEQYCRVILATCLITQLDHERMFDMNDSSAAGYLRQEARRCVEDKMVDDDMVKDRIEDAVKVIQRDWLARYLRYDGLDRRSLRNAG